MMSTVPNTANNNLWKLEEAIQLNRVHEAPSNVTSACPDPYSCKCICTVISTAPEEFPRIAVGSHSDTPSIDHAVAHGRAAIQF